MTKLLEHAVETVRNLPPDMQDDLARILLQLAGKDQPIIQLTAEEEASFAESLAQAARGEFAAEADIDAGKGVPHEQVREWLMKLGKGKKITPPACSKPAL